MLGRDMTSPAFELRNHAVVPQPHLQGQFALGEPAPLAQGAEPAGGPHAKLGGRLHGRLRITGAHAAWSLAVLLFGAHKLFHRNLTST